ncbi:MAG: alpha/beta hydrolase [Spirochaetes bacterium]|nr:alpha/beta hydrolase [Spirochaetota bacterium]
MFEKNIGIFDSSYNIIVWDARGHGLSKMDKSVRFAFKDMFDDCLQLFEIHQIKQAVIIGQSMGGNLAQEIAYRYPEKVTKLVLIGSTINASKLSPPEKLAIKMTRFIFSVYPWKLLISQSANVCGNTGHVKNYAKQCFEKIGKKRFIEIIMSLFDCLHGNDEYRFSVPVLLICGADDKTGNIKKTMAAWAKIDGNCTLFIIPNAGHNSNQDNPEDVNNIILTFLGEGTD